ncbi:uncharacterized protein cubi_01056 [Cryptosporidium ubiquitum]|uniref:GYF domain-containing protein n=1 Tax=Cryptosporidium ubiquitum TaxID=857276 RepID=A0A1J4MMH6_9CRYT|nr:uncharacterized protein cubi_01056 [Cryptosporidium ubiquitum]OII74212.1 hypothetical protein cubi_01056 [Cryptosporidium ubiquitum]
MFGEFKLSRDQNIYYIELSIYLGSIKVTISDDNRIDCRFFSLAFDIEPSFTLENSLQEFSKQTQHIFDDNDSDTDEFEKTQFLTNWYTITDTPIQTTYDIFSTEINGIIKECAINQDICFNLKLPVWVSNMAKQFYNLYNKIGFENFLLTVLQLRITIWATNNTAIESTEMFEVGEVVIKVSENHLLSKNSFYFIHRIPDHDVFAIKEYRKKGEECTIGILRIFFNSKPLIMKNINQNIKVKDVYKKGILSYDASKKSTVQKLEINQKNIQEQLHDFVPLQWEYLDDNNVIRGPYNSIVMMSWIIKGYFAENNLLRLFEIDQECANKSVITRKFEKFKSLKHYFSLIKSDVSRIFRYSPDNELNKELIVRKSINENISLHNTETINKPILQKLNTNFTSISYEKKRIEIENAVNMLKTQFSNIDKEFQNKRKVKDKKKDNDSSKIVNKSSDEFIEFATKNVFRQKNNILFKRWSVEYGPELVLEACAIRIQTAYRKYIRKKHEQTNKNSVMYFKNWKKE